MEDINNMDKINIGDVVEIVGISYKKRAGWTPQYNESCARHVGETATVIEISGTSPKYYHIDISCDCHSNGSNIKFVREELKLLTE